MAEKANPSHPNIFPALRYKDGQAALRWLEEAFGFTRQVAHPNLDGSLAHAQMTHGAGMIMLGSGGKADPQNPWSTESLGVYVQVDDIDAHYARAKAADAEIVRELADTSYGAREYSAHDLDGHLRSFGTYNPWTAD
jgi:uncharacterized glyoxalase superfamily protein PhnB